MNHKYNSILEQFFHTEKITDYSLDKIRSACEYFGNPQDSFQSIHITWTNGKGSTAKMIFQILKQSGKRVWVYTSPHNMDIRERFEVGNGGIRESDFSTSLPLRSKWQKLYNDGNLISESDFVRYATEIIEYGHGLSYFEKCVLLAFLYFREQECEYVVLEVGMWGRLDATNIITPILSIITSISYDHMEYLGDTLEAIASEKWGIIKPWVPVILYGHNLTLEDIAIESGAPVIFPKERHIETNLLGRHQLQNARIAYEAGIFLWLEEATIQSALLHVEHHGRLEYIRPNLLIDGAHNEDGMRQLSHYLSSLDRPWQDIVYCINLKKWKSIQLARDAFPHIQDWVLVRSEHQMVEDVGVLHEQLRMIQQDAIVQTPIQILELAQKNPEKLFVVFGSLYMLGELLELM